MTRVSVAIPTYDGRELLDVVVPSVLAQDVDGDLEVVVVDDGSSDGTPEHVAARWPQIRLVRQPNAGITVAMNRCVSETRGEYVALVNNDVELHPSFLRELVAALDEHPAAGSACGKMLDYGDHSRLDGAGDAIRSSGAPLRRGKGEFDRGQFDAPEAVVSACGGAALYRRAALEDVGPFDEDLIAYTEDIDWGLRAQLRGWTCRYVPSAVCLHMGAATTSRPDVAHRFYRLQRRNSVLLVVKDFPLAVLARHLPGIAAFQLRYLAGSIRQGVGGLHLAAWLDVARALPATVRKRRAIQRTRRVGAGAVEGLLTRGG